MKNMKKRIASSGILIWAVLTISQAVQLGIAFVQHDESTGWTIYLLVVGVPVFLVVVACLIVTIIERRKSTAE